MFLSSRLPKRSLTSRIASRHVAAIVLEAVYGHRITSLDDQYVTLMFRAMEATTATGVAGTTPADILPICKLQQRLSDRSTALSFVWNYSEVRTILGTRRCVQACGAEGREAGVGRSPFTLSLDSTSHGEHRILRCGGADLTRLSESRNRTTLLHVSPSGRSREVRKASRGGGGDHLCCWRHICRWALLLSALRILLMGMTW